MKKQRLTCYEAIDLDKSRCQNKSCRHWVNHKSNCSIQLSKTKKITFKEIGEMFDLTRMRICQIEKKTIDKIRSEIMKNHDLSDVS